jgi:hypothetical protein
LFQSLLKRFGNAKMERKEQTMADNENKKMGPPRIALNDAAAARRSLSRVLRMRFRGELDSATFRDMVYGLNCLLGFDKLQKETEMERRLAGLENKRGQIMLNITPAEAIGLDPDEREKRIIELLEKMGYEEKAAEPEPPQADIPPVPEPVPTIPDAPEPPQSQPRRLKL